MTAKQHARRIAWPIALMILSIGLLSFRSELADLLGQGELLSLGSTALVYFAAAWLASRVLALALDQAASRRQP